MPVFALPWALLGLAALPALAVIYILRRRSQPRSVSSLMLWADQTDLRQGGRNVQRMQWPLTLLLELLALALLVLAAAGPLLARGGAKRPLVVVLDDSFSMLAVADGKTARDRGRQGVLDELDSGTSVQFVLAGQRPRLLGQAVDTLAEPRSLLDQWACTSSSCDLDAAVALAAATGGKRSRILVVTDRPPPEPLGEGRIRWLAVGNDLPNAGIVQAVRSDTGNGDRVLIEIANFSNRDASVKLAMELAGPHPSEGSASGTPLPAGEGGPAERPRTAGTSEGLPSERVISLPPHTRHTITQALTPGTGPMLAALSVDALPIDDAVLLLPDSPQPVTVEIALADPDLAAAVRKALAGIRAARVVPSGGRLIFTDSPTAAGGPDAWAVRFRVDEANSPAFEGPFLCDRSHPLCEGLGLDGEIWSASARPPLTGQTLIAAGDVPLATHVARPDGRREVRIAIRPDRSTLLGSTNWPVLIWNLVHWRAGELPGTRANVRLGETVRVRLPRGTRQVRLTAPDGSQSDLPARDEVLQVQADRRGEYRVQCPGGPAFAFAANALSADESDLAACRTGRWGSWLDEQALREEYRPAAWIALLAALGILAVHLRLIARMPGGRRP